LDSLRSMQVITTDKKNRGEKLLFQNRVEFWNSFATMGPSRQSKTHVYCDHLDTWFAESTKLHIDEQYSTLRYSTEHPAYTGPPPTADQNQPSVGVKLCCFIL
jgi:hypothetical protein